MDLVRFRASFARPARVCLTSNAAPGEEDDVKNSKTCPKCRSSDIIRVPGEARSYGAGNNIVVSGPILFKFVLVMRYVCGSCGFSEEWIDTAEDIAKVRKKYGS